MNISTVKRHLKLRVMFITSSLIYLGVRIFPGQDPPHVYIGWVTTQYHLHSKDFNQSRVRKSSVVILDDFERVIDGQVIVLNKSRSSLKSNSSLSDTVLTKRLQT